MKWLSKLLRYALGRMLQSEKKWPGLFKCLYMDTSAVGADKRMFYYWKLYVSNLLYQILPGYNFLVNIVAKVKMLMQSTVKVADIALPLQR